MEIAKEIIVSYIRQDILSKGCLAWYKILFRDDMIRL